MTPRSLPSPILGTGFLDLFSRLTGACLNLPIPSRELETTVLYDVVSRRNTELPRPLSSTVVSTAIPYHFCSRPRGHPQTARARHSPVVSGRVVCLSVSQACSSKNLLLSRVKPTLNSAVIREKKQRLEGDPRRVSVLISAFSLLQTIPTRL